jgi:hypothetical protein
MVAVENIAEHKAKLPQFLLVIIWYGLLGAMVGGANEWLLRKIQGQRNTRLEALAFIVLQLVFVGVELFIVFQYTQKHTLVFDDWLWNTFAGFIFGVTFFSGQDNITRNIKTFYNTT